MSDAEPSPSKPLQDNVIAAACYIIPFLSVVFLLVDPYRTNKLVRFHAIQSLMIFVVLVVLSIAASILSSILLFVAPLSFYGFFALERLLWLAVFIGVLVLAVRAFQGQGVEVPVIGEQARRYV